MPVATAGKADGEGKREGEAAQKDLGGVSLAAAGPDCQRPARFHQENQ
jgi:hypothetical protein